MAAPWEEYAQPAAPSGPWQEYTPTDSTGSQGSRGDVRNVVRALQGGANRGISSLLGIPVDTIENVMNLGRAAAGSANVAMGNTEQAYPLRTGSVGGSQWISQQLDKLGIRTTNPAPDDALARGAYTAGNIIGSSIVPGARPLPTAAAAVSGAVAGEALGPQWIAPAAMLPAAAAQAMASRAAPMTVRDQTAREAMDAGYRLPPTDVKPGVVNSMLEGTAGKLSTRQALSLKNQSVTDNLAKQAIGLPANTQLTPDAIKAVRDTAGQAYAAVKGANIQVTPDQQYLARLNMLGGNTKAAAADFGDIAKLKPIDDLVQALQPQQMTPSGIVEMVKRLRADATANFRTATNGTNNDPRLFDYARAQRGAADALDSLLERSLSRAGLRDLADNYSNARTLIAKTHDVEAALNPASGNVNADILARLAGKGKPLGGGLETAANTARAFPHAMRPPERAGSVPAISPLDLSVGMGAGLAGATQFGAPGGLAAMLPLIRPAVRSVITSGPYQSGMVMPRAFNEGLESLLPSLTRINALQDATR